MGTCVQSQQEKTNAVQDIGHFIGERREDKETWVRNSQVERDYAGEIQVNVPGKMIQDDQDKMKMIQG